ncbi:hypothetical protein M9H77_27101 [Catharanthus roseus]|uniref:Uncharacterized protein n=1 Tax=Catharanthus roseus TaxID=4058 RepID=A0ACC0AE96_CATRO|nr:hypothetical protein M9H77_27101 [Catharanthus roseus]
MQRVPLEMSERAGRPPVMRGATRERNNKPQVKAKVYALDGLPVETEAEIVEGGKLSPQYIRLFKVIYRVGKDLSTRSALRLRRVDPIEEGRSTVEGLAQLVYVTLYHALRWVGCLVDNQEGLETKNNYKKFLKSHVLIVLLVFSLLSFSAAYCVYTYKCYPRILVLLWNV